MLSLACQEIEQLNFVVPFFSPFGLKIRILCFEVEVPQNISEKKWKLNWKMSSWFHEKSALFRAVSELFKDFQVMYSAEWELKRSWSALIIFESEMIGAKNLWDLNPGYNAWWVLLHYVRILTCTWQFFCQFYQFWDATESILLSSRIVCCATDCRWLIYNFKDTPGANT